jgi:dihydroxy-acid dehydratase
LNVELSDEEIAARLESNPKFEPKIKSGYLARYSRMVQSADRGAVLELPEN